MPLATRRVRFARRISTIHVVQLDDVRRSAIQKGRFDRGHLTRVEQGPTVIHELRAYDLKPGQALAYLETFRTDGVQYVTRHLPMVGYWLTDNGALNRLYHLWPYADMEHRASARAALAEDADWNSRFVPKCFPLILRQQSFFLRALDLSPEVEELLGRTQVPVGQQDPSEAIFASCYHSLSFSAAEVAVSGAEVLGRWSVSSGRDVGAQVTIMRHERGRAIPPDGVLRHEFLRPLALSPLR